MSNIEAAPNTAITIHDAPIDDKGTAPLSTTTPSAPVAKRRAPIFGYLSKTKGERGWKRGLALFDFILKLLAIGATLAATITMATADETLPFFTTQYQFHAQYADLPSLHAKLSKRLAMENGDTNLIGMIPIEAREVLHKLASTWSEVADPDAMEVVMLKGAGEMATNKVFEVKWKSNNLQDGEDKNSSHRRVLLRIYREGAESVFDRENELRVFEAVSRQGQGPKLLARFASGRVEEFIDGRTLSTIDLRDPEISAIIATKLREFHDLDMPGPKKVILWDELRDYLKTARRLSSPEEAKEFYLDMIEEEISSLENDLSSEDQMIGFCHNDLWYGNMIMNEKTKMLTLIDYELACFNPVAFDIANYFCDMTTDFNAEATYIWDYKKYPNLGERKRFVQIYLNSSGEDSKNVELETFLKIVEKYVLARHLFCALGTMAMGYTDSTCKEYAREKFRQYWLRKPQTLG